MNFPNYSADARDYPEIVQGYIFVIVLGVITAVASVSKVTKETLFSQRGHNFRKRLNIKGDRDEKFWRTSWS